MIDPSKINIGDELIFKPWKEAEIAIVKANYLIKWDKESYEYHFSFNAKAIYRDSIGNYKLDNGKKTLWIAGSAIPLFVAKVNPKGNYMEWKWLI